MASGEGKFSWPSGASYEGMLRSGWMEGFGTFISANGETYEGDWIADQKHGLGKKRYANGDFYGGDWRNDLREGKGMYMWRNEIDYVGEWRGGVMSGKGALIWPNGKRFEGYWENGIPNGEGVLAWPGGSIYSPSWGSLMHLPVKEASAEEEGRRKPMSAGQLPRICIWEGDGEAGDMTTDPTNLSPNIRDPREIKGAWEKGKHLGSGSFGTVYEGIVEAGYFFAVKEVSLLDQGSQGRQSIVQLEQEIALLSQFKHENIVQYFGSQTDESKFYIFLELVSQGSLMNLYNRFHLRDSQVSAYTRQILHGLKYLHERNVVHRDIKCANILVDTNGSVKLADFGLAKVTKLNDVKSSKGTACWMAPEVVNLKNQGYGLPADIWSLGCTVLEMLTSQIPYSELDSFQAIYRIGKGIPPTVPESLSTDARDFILQCLKVDPSARPTAAQLLDHPFLKRPLSILSGSASPYIGRRSRDFAPPQL